MKHTKGPWSNYKGLICQANNSGIARIVSSGTEADANLIAAAPDMLEALNESAETLKRAAKLALDAGFDGTADSYLLQVEDIKLLIKKARGEK